MAKKKKRLTLFQKPTYKKYAKIISFKNPVEARKSTKKLEEEFANSKTNAKKLRIARIAQYSANRAKATVKRKNLSRAEKSEYRKISTIYDNSANLFFKEYGYYKKKTQSIRSKKDEGNKTYKEAVKDYKNWLDKKYSDPKFKGEMMRSWKEGGWKGSMIDGYNPKKDPTYPNTKK